MKAWTNSFKHWHGSIFTKYDSKSRNHRRLINSSIKNKFKTSSWKSKTISKIKRQMTIWGKYLQVSITNSLSPNYIKNSQKCRQVSNNLIAKRGKVHKLTVHKKIVMVPLSLAKKFRSLTIYPAGQSVWKQIPSVQLIAVHNSSGG